MALHVLERLKNETIIFKINLKGTESFQLQDFVVLILMLPQDLTASC